MAPKRKKASTSSHKKVSHKKQKDVPSNEPTTPGLADPSSPTSLQSDAGMQ